MMPLSPSPGSGWFRVDNAVLEHIATVGMTAVCVYVVLARYANNDSRTCYVGVETVAKTLGITPQAVRNCLKKLAVAQMITVEHRQHERGRTLTNLYRLLDVAPREQAQPTLGLPNGGSTVVEGEAQPGLRGEGQPTLTQRRLLVEEDSLKKKTPSSAPKLRFVEADMETAKWMFCKIRALDGSQKEPSYPNWANTIRLIRERDGRTDQEIRDLFAWSNADSFWRTNILSPAKLREKWGQLSLKQKVGTNGHSRAYDHVAAGRCR